MSTRKKDRESHKLLPFPESLYEEFKSAVEGKISLRAYKDSDKAEEEMIKGALYSSVREAIKVIKFDGNFQNYGDAYLTYRLIDRMGIARIPISLLAPLLSEVKKTNEALYNDFLSKAERFGEMTSSLLRSQTEFTDSRDLIKYVSVVAPHVEIMNLKVSEDMAEIYLKVLNATDEVLELTKAILFGFFSGLGMSVLDFDVGGDIIMLKAIRGKAVSVGKRKE